MKEGRAAYWAISSSMVAVRVEVSIRTGFPHGPSQPRLEYLLS